MRRYRAASAALESKKQELESYLADLNAQYEDLTNSISELSIQAAEKEDELNKVKTELTKAKKASADQYESMKLRIAYMYENAGTSALETLLSSESLAEFLNRAENAIQISTYDRNMLDKYISLQKNIQENEQKVETESAEIDNLMTERASKQQEVQSMAASTSERYQLLCESDQCQPGRSPEADGGYQQCGQQYYCSGTAGRS